MRSSEWASVILTFITLAAAAPADGLPSFTRKHGMKCSQCHAIFPKLTPLGRKFKENGFRLPDDETSWEEMLWSVPGSIRLGLQSQFLQTRGREPVPAEPFGPTTGTLEPITAGGGSSWISFWMNWPIRASTEELEDVGREHYWARVNDVLRSLRPNLLHVKGGQFELDLPFAQSRTYNLFPYAPYSLGGSEGLAAAHRGIELSGEPGRGFRYSLAVADSSGRPSSEDESVDFVVEEPFDPDFYLRFSKTFTNDNRLGLFLYRSKDTHRLISEIGFGPTPFDFEVTSRDELIGADFDWLSGSRRFNAYGLFLLGRKDLENVSLLDFQSGFAQLDARLVSSLTLVGRYTWTRTVAERAALLDELPGEFRLVVQQDLTIGCQLLVIDRLKVAFEYRVVYDERDASRAAVAVDFIL